MPSSEFPGCCTARVISGFGHCHTSIQGAEFTNAENLKKHLLHLRRNGYAVATAITTNTQTDGVKTLTEFGGWQSSEWMSKTQHPETKIKLWWYPLEQLGEV